jgi:hypothetical protein
VKRLLVACALSAFFFLAACAPHDVLVGEVAAEVGCAVREDCGDGSFCAKASCGASRGTCKRRPVVCNAESSPVCGCDGVSYWNDCLRERSGVAMRAVGECLEGGAACGGDRPACPAPGATCSKLVDRRESCGAPSGVCWMLPDHCLGAPPPPGGAPASPRYIACEGDTSCHDVCEALRLGAAYRAESPRACGP